MAPSVIARSGTSAKSALGRISRAPPGAGPKDWDRRSRRAPARSPARQAAVRRRSPANRGRASTHSPASSNRSSTPDYRAGVAFFPSAPASARPPRPCGAPAPALSRTGRAAGSAPTSPRVSIVQPARRRREQQQRADQDDADTGVGRAGHALHLALQHLPARRRIARRVRRENIRRGKDQDDLHRELQDDQWAEDQGDEYPEIQPNGCNACAESLPNPRCEIRPTENPPYPTPAFAPVYRPRGRVPIAQPPRIGGKRPAIPSKRPAASSPTCPAPTMTAQ